MTRIDGVVLDGGRVVVPAAAAWIEVATTPGGRAEWFGHLDLPAGAELMPKGYEFRAADGRAGRLRVLWSVAHTGGGVTAEFRGCGPLR
jgi:hypothetical protein